MKRIVGFAGSPRVGGNSDLLLDEWLKGAEAAGARVEKVFLDHLSIDPCVHCDACREPNSAGCVKIDDMDLVYEKLLAANLWVLATPVYWWGPSAQLKLMVDRWYGLMKNHRSSLVGKQAALVIAMGDDDLKTAQPTIDMFASAFNYLKMKMHEPLVITAHDKGEVLKDKEALMKAYSLGTKYGG
jgi:multimeric flavodoxin WrbA